jgi:hypothetical protein
MIYEKSLVVCRNYSPVIYPFQMDVPEVGRLHFVYKYYIPKDMPPPGERTFNEPLAATWTPNFEREDIDMLWTAVFSKRLVNPEPLELKRKRMKTQHHPIEQNLDILQLHLLNCFAGLKGKLYPDNNDDIIGTYVLPH